MSISTIKEEKFQKIFSRTEEDFKNASNFFKELYEENLKEKKENLSPIVEIEELKMPIPENKEELLEDKYCQRFKSRFTRKFSERFVLGKIRCDIVLENPEFSFLLFITESPKRKKYLFENEVKYIGIDYTGYSDDLALISIVTSDDK